MTRFHPQLHYSLMNNNVPPNKLFFPFFFLFRKILKKIQKDMAKHTIHPFEKYIITRINK